MRIEDMSFLSSLLYKLYNLLLFVASNEWTTYELKARTDFVNGSVNYYQPKSKQLIVKNRYDLMVISTIQYMHDNVMYTH